MSDSSQVPVVSSRPEEPRPRVWQMNAEECYAAITLEDALKAMAETLCYETPPEGIAEMRKEFSVDDPVALTDEELLAKKVRIGDPDDERNDISITFREYLDELVAGDELPCLFSSTGY